MDSDTFGTHFESQEGLYCVVKIAVNLHIYEYAGEKPSNFMTVVHYSAYQRHDGGRWVRWFG